MHCPNMFLSLLDEVVFAVISQVANEVHQKSMDNARKEGVVSILAGLDDGVGTWQLY